jgi:hypothetical protein
VRRNIGIVFIHRHNRSPLDSRARGTMRGCGYNFVARVCWKLVGWRPSSCSNPAFTRRSDAILDDES